MLGGSGRLWDDSWTPLERLLEASGLIVKLHSLLRCCVRYSGTATVAAFTIAMLSLLLLWFLRSLLWHCVCYCGTAFAIVVSAFAIAVLRSLFWEFAAFAILGVCCYCGFCVRYCGILISFIGGNGQWQSS